MNLKRTLFLYFRFIGQQMKAILEYRADFLVLVVAAMLTQVLGLIFIWVVYDRIPEINGWGFWEVIFIYSIMNFATGFIQLFFEGMWRIGFLVNSGGFDRVLVRPVSPVLQVMSFAVGMNGLGNMLLGGIMLVQSLTHVTIEWTWSKALFFGLLFVCIIAIRTSIALAANSLVFWTQAPNNAFPVMVSSLADFTKFPITIYGLGVQAFFSVVIPYAFVSFYPAAYLFDKAGWSQLGMLTPIVAVYCLAASIWMFRSGLARYEGAGN
jgi:ABC-2 type transport system permease protein